jgi:hypothetical protein
MQVCINMMLDLDPVHRADMKTVTQCDYLRDQDISDDEVSISNA